MFEQVDKVLQDAEKKDRSGSKTVFCSLDCRAGVSVVRNVDAPGGAAAAAKKEPRQVLANLGNADWITPPLDFNEIRYVVDLHSSINLLENLSGVIAANCESFPNLDAGATVRKASDGRQQSSDVPRDKTAMCPGTFSVTPGTSLRHRQGSRGGADLDGGWAGD